MREIKFRFWSKHLNHFVKPDDSVFVGALKDEDMNPMQFTGLKDKNGKDIYEGDVVCWRFPKHKNSGICSDLKISPHLFHRVIEYNDGQTQFTSPRNEDGHVEQTEVIGNIYENSDLLK